MADDDLHDWRDAADYLKGLVASGQLGRLPPGQVEGLILSLIETAEAARRELERSDDGDDDPGRAAVH